MLLVTSFFFYRFNNKGVSSDIVHSLAGGRNTPMYLVYIYPYSMRLLTDFLSKNDKHRPRGLMRLSMYIVLLLVKPNLHSVAWKRSMTCPMSNVHLYLYLRLPVRPVYGLQAYEVHIEFS
jgi:hypothetical protein